tara:strand:+ start:4583 stop:5341 length:759 start_codon:yes stop_codon:yes gene_type:complete
MKVVVIEDGVNIAAQMKRNIELYSDDTNVVQVLSCVADAKEYFNENNLPDLIFSDIELSDGLCFDIFEDFKIDCPIIFTTAFNEYWQKAFTTNSIDYLLKPISKQTLHKSIDQYLDVKSFYETNNKISSLIKNIESEEDKKKERFLLRKGNKYELVNIIDLKYIVSADKLSFFTTKDNQQYASYDSLDKIETQLDPSKFFRINRKYVVNISCVKQIIPHSRGKILIHLHQGESDELIVSQSKANEFRTWLNY